MKAVTTKSASIATDSMLVVQTSKRATSQKSAN